MATSCQCHQTALALKFAFGSLHEVNVVCEGRHGGVVVVRVSCLIFCRKVLNITGDRRRRTPTVVWRKPPSRLLSRAVLIQSVVCFHELNEALRHAEFSPHVPSRSRPSQSNVKCIFKVDKVVKRSLLVLKMILHQNATIGNLFRHSCWMSASPSCQQSPLWSS